MPEFKKTFIITSVIHFSSKKLSNNAIRSVFSPEERIGQTIKTVESIREKVKGAAIILIEMGTERNISQELISKVDKYIFLGDNKLVRWASRGKRRGLGEAMGLIAAKNELNNGSDFYFKMSGRYVLNSNFSPELWQGDLFFARKYGKGISTRLYGFGKDFFYDWQRTLKRSLFKLYIGRSIEDVLPAKLGHERIHEIKTLGVSGYVAPDGSYLEE